MRIPIFLFILAYVSSCATSPTGRSQLLLVPESEMNQMGQKSFQELKNTKRVEHEVATNNYVKCVANAIIDAAQSESPIKNWEVVVFQDPTANAFALPGGKIGVNTGLLKVAVTQDQLASVIGHEVGHVLAKHGSERVSQAVATQAGLSVLNEFLNKKSQNRELILAGLGLGAQFGILLPYSRKHESEADEIGLFLMAKAGFDPRGSVELWQNMARANQGAPPEFLSTHPSNRSRIADLNANMNKAVQIYEQAAQQGTRPNCSKVR